MALTFLNLVNKVLKPLNEVPLDSSTFASATGFHAEAKDAINASILYIHQYEQFQWPFNSSTGTVSLTADGTTEFSLSASAAVVDWNSFAIRNETIGSEEVSFQALRKISRDVYRKYIWASDKNKTDPEDYSKPQLVVQNVDNKLIISPPADLAYTVEYKYWTAPTALTLHSDTTTIPDAYENVILEGAKYYGYMFRDNMEQAAIIQKRFDDMIVRMRLVQTPEQDYVHFDN